MTNNFLSYSLVKQVGYQGSNLGSETPSQNLQGIYIGEEIGPYPRSSFWISYVGSSLLLFSQGNNSISPQELLCGAFFVLAHSVCRNGEHGTLCPISVYSAYFPEDLRRNRQGSLSHSSHFFLPFFFQVLGGGGVGLGPKLEHRCVWLQSLRARMDAGQ